MRYDYNITNTTPEWEQAKILKELLGQVETLTLGGGGGISYAPQRRLEASPIYVYGHSYALTPGAMCTSGAEWFNRLKTRLSAPSVTTYGVSSGRMLDAMMDALNTGPSFITGCTWPGGATRRGLILLDQFANDVYNTSAASGASTSTALTSTQLTNIGDALRTFLAVVSSSARVEMTTTTGTGWASNSATAYSGGSTMRTGVQGDYVEGTVTVTPTGVVYLLTWAFSSLTPASFDVAVDGVTVASVSSASIVRAATLDRRSASTQIAVPVPVKLTGLSAGSHTIRVTKTDATANQVYVDACFPQAAAPNPIVVLKDPVFRSGASTLDATMVANRILLSPVWNTVCADFSNVLLVDPALDPITDLGSDNTHPNDRGMGKMTDAVMSAFGAWSYDPDWLYTTAP